MLVDTSPALKSRDKHQGWIVGSLTCASRMPPDASCSKIDTASGRSRSVPSPFLRQDAYEYLDRHRRDSFREGQSLGEMLNR